MPVATPSSLAGIHSATIPQDRLLPGILGLRGIAAIAVVLFHLNHLAGLAVPQPFSFISSDFGYGVHLFFVLSAFSLMHSTEHTMFRSTWANEYLIKRFWRIAPLYYGIMAFIILRPAITSHPVTVDAQALLLNLTFTFNFAPWAGIVWGGWAVGVEMLFYVIFPVLLLTIRTTSTAFILVIVSLVISYVSRSTLQVHYESTMPQYDYNWAYFSFAPNLYFFAMGIYAYRLSHELSPALKASRWLIPFFSVACLGLLMLTGLDNPLKGAGRMDLMLWGCGFVALSIWQSNRPSFWSANRLLAYVGERSYSLYLLHPVIISLFLKQPLQNVYAELSPQLGEYAFFICAALLLVPLIALSEITYRLIELPGIRVGQRINKRIRANTRSHKNPH